MTTEKLHRNFYYKIDPKRDRNPAYYLLREKKEICCAGRRVNNSRVGLLALHLGKEQIPRIKEDRKEAKPVDLYATYSDMSNRTSCHMQV